MAIGFGFPQNVQFRSTDKIKLRLKFGVLGSNTNAGIQFRSQRVPESSEMIG